MSGRMVNAATFAAEPRASVPRSAIRMPSFHKTSFGAGQLIPLLIQDCLPGDEFHCKLSALVRLAPMIVPAMDNLAFHTWGFFVPHRLVWSHFEEFMGASSDPNATPVQYLIPQITDIGDVATRAGKLADYMGITNNASGVNVSVNALPFRAYLQIWNYWFRDTALIPAVSVPTGDGPDGIGSYVLQGIQKAKDYFTTCRPFPASAAEFANATSWVGESGFTQGPLVPGGRMTFQQTTYGVGAPVHGIGFTQAAGGTAAGIKETGGRTVDYSPSFNTGAQTAYFQAGTGGFPDVRVLVNDIRTASMIQRYLEADARGGNQYSVKNWFHFGVRSPDSRLQRPEYIGGGRTMVTINPVAQTSASAVSGANFSASTVLGSLAATGYAPVREHSFKYSAVEHGYILILGGVRGDLTYQQGIERLWRIKTPFDIYTPETHNLGEQAVMKSELYSDGSANDVLVFGYQERWGEYRWKMSRTSGFMRSTARDGAGLASTIDMWHFGQKFASVPSLNGVFLLEDPAVSRSLQASAPYAATFFGDLMFDQVMVRPLGMWSIPGVGGRI